MSDTSPDAPGPDTRERLHERLTDPARIRSVLNGLRDNRALLSARADHGGDYFNTTLLKVDPDGGCLYLDELSPRDGHEALATGDTLHVYGVFKGVPAHFACMVDHIDEQNDIAFYRAPLPAVMDYQQRRAHFRAYVGMGVDATLDLRLQEGTPVEGRLQDISLGGFGALLPPDSAVKPLDSITVETLQIPGREAITCTAQIRNTYSSQGRIRIGARFTNLASRAERELLRMILELEREQIRRQTRA